MAIQVCFFFFSWIVNFSNKMFKFYYLWHCMKLDICVIFSDYTTWLDQKRNAYYFLHFMLRSQFYLITKCYIQLLPNFQKCWMTKNAFSNELYQGFSLRNIWWIRYIDNNKKSHQNFMIRKFPRRINKILNDTKIKDCPYIQ